MGLKTKRLLKEWNHDKNVIPIYDYNDSMELANDNGYKPYIITIGDENYLAFSDSDYNAVDDVMEFMFTQMKSDYIYTQDEVYDIIYSEYILNDNEYNELRESLEDIEKKLDFVDMDWDEYKEIEKEKDRVEEELEDLETYLMDEYMNENFTGHSEENLFIYNNWESEEIDREQALMIIDEYYGK